MFSDLLYMVDSEKIQVKERHKRTSEKRTKSRRAIKPAFYFAVNPAQDHKQAASIGELLREYALFARTRNKTRIYIQKYRNAIQRRTGANNGIRLKSSKKITRLHAQKAKSRFIIGRARKLRPRV